MELASVPEAWNAKMQTYLGIDTTGDFKNGCLQDVHWPAGLFGYFPTYSLGAMMAAQLLSAAKRDIPQLLEQIAVGDFSLLLGWLRDHVHGHGRRYPVHELLTRATGEGLNPEYFLTHLKQRYLATDE